MASECAGNVTDTEMLIQSMRRKAEECLAASVHHASLSQQYLTLAQKYSGLAEQAATGGQGVPVLAAQVASLNREAESGAPSAPMGIVQSQLSFATGMQAESNAMPHSLPNASPSTTERLPDEGSVSSTANKRELTGSELARISELPEARKESFASDDVSSPVPLNAHTTKKAVPARRKKSRRVLTVRSFLQRVRIAALESAERIRLRTRKTDLKPRIRKTSEEITEELKRSRLPASLSTVVTILAVGILAFCQLEFVEPVELPPLVASFSLAEEPEQSVVMETPLETAGEQTLEETDPVPEVPPEEVPEPVPEPEPEVPEAEEMETAPDESAEMEPMSDPAEDSDMADDSLIAEQNKLPETMDGKEPVTPKSGRKSTSTGIEHRTDAGRRMMLQKYGGTAGSEMAVAQALEWLSRRQRRDGSWDFTDVGPCTAQGKIMNPIGGTAYALLPFLAAGHTHRQGPYRKVVQGGLEFLTNVGVAVPAGYDLRGVINKADKDEEPNYAYYVHGAATLALCEAYAMTKDRKLRPACEGAVRFLISSQDPRGGGWRYLPQQPGSTSCTAIQVMALKTAEKAGLLVPDATWQGAGFYLDSVSIDREGRYGYEIEKKSYDASVTAMALLCRMYLGWNREDGDLRQGVGLLDKKGPYDNFYYNYFATQVMKNWGGAEWYRWNERLRDDLIAWQETEGEALGSWAPRDRSEYSLSGGRLLTTCLATLTLEVYYRYEPLLPPEDSE